MFTTKRKMFRGLVDRANLARDLKQYAAAAALYSEALRLRPTAGPIHVQCGHMYKEAGDLDRAEEHYLAAKRLMPNDADLALQLGHYYKTSGRLDEARAAYRRALDLKEGWAEPHRELGALSNTHSEFEATAAALGITSDLDDLAPELVPKTREDLLRSHSEYIDIRRLGRHESNRWGSPRTLRGVEAIRGFCISQSPVSELRITLDGTLLFAGPVRGPYELEYEKNKDRVQKYVFNVWHDFGSTEPGAYDIELRFLNGSDRPQVFSERVVVAPAIPEHEYPGSDALLNSPPEAPGLSLEQRINLRPSMVRPARRRLFAEPPRNILVQRTDQLGDMVCSIPAMRRLREGFPDARIVGLLTSGNADLGRSLGLFDEVLVIDFPDDRWERRRIMPLADQKKLRDRLKPYNFDIAIDLAESAVSRPLLRLSGAKFLFGFREREFHYLTAGYEGNTRDRFNGMEIASHSTKVLASIERLVGLTVSHSQTITRPDLSRDLLRPYGLHEDEFVVLHLGARIRYSRWPGYFELASMLLAQTDKKVVMMADDPALRSTVPNDLLCSDRFQFLDRLLPFDHFDALLSFCSGFVGNDSGPKHLASLRGANVVSIHMARNNWAEWGQDHSGLIVSRKVPCAGCALYYEPEECGKDFACITNVKPTEVFEALRGLMQTRLARERQSAH